MSSNFTENGLSRESQGWSLFLALDAIIVSVLAVAFNATLILVFLKTRSLRTPTNTFIISLAIGEILVGLFHVPFVASSILANGWPFSNPLCRASASLQVLGRTVATFSLMSVCIDRCVAVSRPLMYSHLITFKFAAVMLSSIWPLALLVATLPLGNWGSYRYSETFHACILHGTKGHHQHLIKELICTFGPSVCILICLVIVVREVKYHHRVFAILPMPQPQAVLTTDVAALPVSGFLPGIRSFNRNTMKALRPLFIMCFFYGVFCLPTAGLYLAVQRGPVSGIYPGQHVIVWLSLLSSVLNPVVVILFKRKFRETAKSMICVPFLRFRWSPGNKDPFTISSGLQGILSETTLISKIAKSCTASPNLTMAASRVAPSMMRTTVAPY